MASWGGLQLWYQPRRLAYPWRRTRDAYPILVSEVMLQQTQAARVVPLYEAFLERFPTVTDLAEAPRSEVVRAWAGLGYNRRAVALSEAAREIVRAHGGRVPADAKVLVTLPGVGPYTAAAVASIAFGIAVPAMDTNVRRVVARYRLGVEPHEATTDTIRAEASLWLDPDDPGGFNQALMDLGRTVCRPRPMCGECPLRAACRFSSSGRIAAPPRRRLSGFQGSMRQVRGAVVATLRVRHSVTLARLAIATGYPVDQIAAATADLAADGLVRAGPGALAGRQSGRVRLAP